MIRNLKNILIVFVIGTLVFIAGSGFFNKFQYADYRELFTDFLFYQIYAFVLGFSNINFFSYLNTRKWKEGSGNKRLAIGIFGSFIISMFGLFLLRMGTAVFYQGVSFSDYISNERIENFYFGIWAISTVVIIFHIVYYYNKFQKKKVKESQIVAKNQKAKFESLKNQLDPHFLFNSLNVLTSLIGENPYQAEKFTTKLSKVYRYVLEQKDKDLISLTEELKFAKSYMELLQMRFEEAIEFVIPNTISDEELKIVPLSLQLLLENAVKHNVITSNQPLKIKIYEDQGYLIIENTVNPKESLGKSTKVGLKNIKQRYELISSNKMTVENNGKVFKVSLPLLTQKIKIMKTDYMNDSANYLRAKKRVEDLKGFYGSMMAYVIVIPFLIFINYRTSWGFQWFWFPMFGWGIGLLIQAFTVYGIGSNWEDRKIKEIMEKNSQNKY